MTAKPLPIPKPKPAGVEAVRKVKGAEATAIRDLVRETPSWLTSVLVHLVVLLTLALLTLPTKALQVPPVILSGPDLDVDELDDGGDRQPTKIVFGDPGADDGRAAGRRRASGRVRAG